MPCSLRLAAPTRQSSRDHQTTVRSEPAIGSGASEALEDGPRDACVVIIISDPVVDVRREAVAKSSPRRGGGAFSIGNYRSLSTCRGDHDHRDAGALTQGQLLVHSRRVRATFGRSATHDHGDVHASRPDHGLAHLPSGLIASLRWLRPSQWPPHERKTTRRATHQRRRSESRGCAGWHRVAVLHEPPPRRVV